ncbi:MAG: hypothetical protein ABSA78_12435 [Candidatus Sulfotelmatobacter sp.]
MKTSWTILPFPCASSLTDRRTLRKDLLIALRSSGSPVIVDFSDCRTLNSEDIDLLLECVAQAAGRAAKVLFVAGSRVNRVLLEVTRISSLVPIFNSVEEALAYPQIVAEEDLADRRAS